MQALGKGMLDDNNNTFNDLITTKSNEELLLYLWVWLLKDSEVVLLG